MIPGALVTLPALPLTANGKVDRRALPVPGTATGAFAPGAAYEPPSGPVETALAEVWQEVLGHERVGALDNYFALGGDSIRSLQVLARARDRGLRFGVVDLMRHQTVRGWPRPSPTTRARRGRHRRTSRSRCSPRRTGPRSRTGWTTPTR